MKNIAYGSVVGVGASIIDQILHVSEDFLTKNLGKKGGMEPISYSMLTNLLEHLRVEPQLIPGGSCANVIRGFAHLGHPCSFIGKIGNDKLGQHFIEQLLSLKIHPFCTTSAIATGQVLSFVTPDGERTFRSYLGANQDLMPEDISPKQFSTCKLSHIEGYTLLYPNVTKKAMECAKEANSLISFDLANFEIVRLFQPMILELLSQYVDICFANEEEAFTLTKLPPKAACHALKKMCSTVVISMGKRGCWIGQGSVMKHYPAYPVVPLDTTGAGDLFACGFLHGYLRNKPLETCAHFGALAGKAVVQVQGSSLSDEEWAALRAQFEDPT